MKNAVFWDMSGIEFRPSDLQPAADDHDKIIIIIITIIIIMEFRLILIMEEI
jgi:hypothetical protein